MPGSSDNGEDARLERRAFLTRGGLVAGGAALGAALTMNPAGAQVTGVQFTYFPVPPTRVFDSRTAGTGPLGVGSVLTLSTGLHLADPAPIAITINMTVTLTHQKGWIACFPANTTFDGTSSINWFGDFQDLANNAFVEIPNDAAPATDGKVKFTAGGIAGASAHLVIDFIGASAPIDYGSGAVAGAAAAYQTPWTVD
jgi:hypothetical protein